MFQINDDKSIYVTRGDIVTFTVGAKNKDNDESYIFRVNDVVRIKVVEKKGCDVVVLQKDFLVEEETERVTIFLSEEDTRIGEVISKPTDYWYEIELNPNTYPQTIIGYDEDGAKIFKLYPEGKDLEFAPTPDTNSLAYRVERHLEDTYVHITGEERKVWNKNTVDIKDHKDDTTVHVTKEEKGSWNKTVVDFNGLSGLVNSHIKDSTVHVTSEEKNTWNNKSDFSGSYNDLTDKPTIPDEVDLTDYVKNTDYATNEKAGVVRVGGDSAGVKLTDAGMLVIEGAGVSEIQNMASANRPITPLYLKYAIRTGLSKNDLEWTDEEKASARKLIGAISKDDVFDKVTLTDTETGTKYQLSVVSGKLTMKEVE